jgi:dynein heavy chain 1
MFEVESLKYATLATVSRCGMVWFSEEVVSLDMIYYHYLQRLKQDDFDSTGEKGEKEGEVKKEEAKLSPEDLRNKQV